VCISPKTNSAGMMLFFILPSLLVQTAFAFGLREARVGNVAEVKTSGMSFLQTGVPQESAVEQLRERAKKLQEELAALPSDDLGVKQAEETAFEVSTDDLHVPASLVVKAAATHTSSSSDAEILARLSANVDSISNSGGDDDEEEEDEISGGSNVATSTRPNAANKVPDVIHFGLFAKTFYGVNVKNNNFAIDVVMTLKWEDKRVAKLIPDGLESMTLSKLDSEKFMWLPGIVITNRDIKKFDLISTAVFINRKGEVSKVERATAVVKNRYMLEQFPFDRQELVTKIASHKYMNNEVALKPDKEGNGAKDGLLEGECYSLVDLKASAYEDESGALKKSRGVLTITVDRTIDKYLESHLIPGALVTMISWAVFWFPFVAPFITPRLAMSVLALLTFTNLTMKSSASLPAGAPPNWNDTINQTIMTLMFTTVVLSILSEVCMHQLKVEELAKKVNNELKGIMPCMSIIALSIILSAAGHDGWMTLSTTSTIVSIFLGASLLGYVSYTGSRIVSALAMKRAQELANDAKK